MVSLTGAQNAVPLVARVTSLQTLINQLQAQASPGPILIWKISLDAYVGAAPNNPSQNFLINQPLTATNSSNIGTAILNALKAELATAQTSLAAIT